MSVVTKTLALATLFLFSLVALSGAAESSASDLFGFGQGIFHPSLKVSTQYSDNYKAVPDHEEGEWKTTISPGFWLAIPSTRKQVFSIVTSKAAPGGQGVSRFQDDQYKGFQGSLMYNADIVRSHDDSAEDEIKHHGQGMLQYAFANGLALELSDVYLKSSEENADTYGSELEKFNSNLVSLIAFYEFSPNLRARIGYSDFQLNYTSGVNVDFKERSDEQVSAYLIYRVLPKTEVFVQYDHINQDYEMDVLADSTEQHIFAGLKFDATARISGHLKVGYGVIDTDQAQNDKFEDLIGDASLKYAFSKKTSITLTAQQIANVSDEEAYQSILHSEIGLALAHQITEKIGATVSIGYKEKEYRYDSDDSGREDEDRVAGLRLNYKLRDWLTLGARYGYTDRTSNVDSKEYTENLLMFSAAAAF